MCLMLWRALASRGVGPVYARLKPMDSAVMSLVSLVSLVAGETVAAANITVWERFNVHSVSSCIESAQGVDGKRYS
jgi:hypothetical protein